MKRLLSSAALLAATLLAAAPSVVAQTPAAPAPGAVVRDARGEVLGRIETVVTDNAGRPAQVIVRSRGIPPGKGVLRALPASSLQRAVDGFSTPLRKSEFEVLPPVRR